MRFLIFFSLCLMLFFVPSCGSKKRTNVSDYLPDMSGDFIPPEPVDLGPVPEGTFAGELFSKLIAGREYRFRWIPPGTFTMGTDTDPDRFFVQTGSFQVEMEAPAHRVTITRGFWLLENEVTQDQWYSQMGTSPSQIKGSILPVVNIQYVDIVNAQGFFEKLHRQTMRSSKFFLPTEAQWEYAYRAGTTTRFYWGDSNALLDANAWTASNSGGTLHAVASKTPNNWNLYDMAGNAYEIVSDYASFYTSDAQVDPQGPSVGSIRVYRGGSYKSNAANCRGTNRILDQQLVAYDNQGFRFIMLPD